MLAQEMDSNLNTNFTIVMRQMLWLEMGFAMMKQTMLIVYMMEVIVVDLVYWKNIVQNVYVTKEILKVNSITHWLEMEYAIMKLTL